MRKLIPTWSLLPIMNEVALTIYQAYPEFADDRVVRTATQIATKELQATFNQKNQPTKQQFLQIITNALAQVLNQ